MGFDTGCSIAFGLLISEHADKFGALLDEFKVAVDDARGADDDSIDEQMVLVGDAWAHKFVAKAAQAGIAIPGTATLLWTGSEDERPGRCQTAADEWVLGFGWMKPWEYPAMDQSFRDVAAWHSWVWGS